MSGWMVLVEAAVRMWAAGHGRAAVDAAVKSALLEGAPTREVIEFARRRIAHHRGAAVRA